MHQFAKLDVWQMSMDLTVEIYELTRKFPPEEKFGLILQMRKAAVSIPSNISEGGGRDSKKDFQRFLSYASGSASELYTQMILCGRLGLVEKQKEKSLCDIIVHIINMLNKLRFTIKE